MKLKQSLCLAAMFMMPLLLLSQPSLPPQSTGLVLCLSNNPGGDHDPREPQTEYQTFWFTYKGERVSLLARFPGCLVPRKDGWWYVQVTSRDDGNSHIEESLWAEPLGRAPSFAPIDDACATTTTTREITFLGTDYVGFSEFGSAVCAHYGENTSYQLHRLDDFEDLKSKYKQNESYDVGIKLCNPLPSRREKLACRKKLSEPFQHTNGHWSPSLPALTGYDSLKPSWGLVKAKIPAADAISSPDGRLLVVFTGTDIAFYRPNHLDKPLALFPQWTVMPMIMAQWAIGPYVDKWERDLADASHKIQTIMQPEYETKFKQVEKTTVDTFGQGLPAQPLVDWLHGAFPGSQFFWDSGPCVEPAFATPAPAECTNVEFPVHDRMVRLSFDAGTLQDTRPPKFFSGSVKLGRQSYVLKTLADLPEKLSSKFAAR